MTDVERAPEIRGKTIRMTWRSGPTKGETHEHVFHQDGTVEYHPVGAAPGKKEATEHPEYAAVKVADGIYAFSYLAPSGYTLTGVLNFQNKKIVGFASGSKEWYPVQGTFEVVNEPRGS
jgi:hypothetical protein